MEHPNGNPKRLLCYVISGGRDGKSSFWNRCGCGFQNRDGSITLRLDMFPGLDLQLREPPERNGNGNGHVAAATVQEVGL